MGMRDKPIAPGSPWQNGYVERLIGTIRRERLVMARGALMSKRKICHRLQMLAHALDMPGVHEPARLTCPPPTGMRISQQRSLTRAPREIIVNLTAVRSKREEIQLVVS
jgi:transposase InsO family protein